MINCEFNGLYFAELNQPLLPAHVQAAIETLLCEAVFLRRIRFEMSNKVYHNIIRQRERYYARREPTANAVFGGNLVHAAEQLIDATRNRPMSHSASWIGDTHE